MGALRWVNQIPMPSGPDGARTLLHSGVTTLRENGAKGKVAFSLREGIRRKLAPGPRMVICGRPIAITGGHMGYFGSVSHAPP